METRIPVRAPTGAPVLRFVLVLLIAGAAPGACQPDTSPPPGAMQVQAPLVAGAPQVRELRIEKRADNKIAWRVGQPPTAAETSIEARLIMEIDPTPPGDGPRTLRLIGVDAETSSLGPGRGHLRMNLAQDPSPGLLDGDEFDVEAELNLFYPDLALAGERRFSERSDHGNRVARGLRARARVRGTFEAGGLARVELALATGPGVPAQVGGQATGSLLASVEDDKKCKFLCLDVKVAKTGTAVVATDAKIQEWIDQATRIFCKQCCIFFKWSGSATPWNAPAEAPALVIPDQVRGGGSRSADVLKVKRSDTCWNLYFIRDFVGEVGFQEYGATYPDGNSGSLVAAEPGLGIARDVPGVGNTLAHELGHALGLRGGDGTDDEGVDKHHKDKKNLNNGLGVEGAELTANQCNRLRSSQKLEVEDKPCECKPGVGEQKDCPCTDGKGGNGGGGSGGNGGGGSGGNGGGGSGGNGGGGSGAAGGT